MADASKRFYLVAACVAVATAIGAVSTARAAGTFSVRPAKLATSIPYGGAPARAVAGPASLPVVQRAVAGTAPLPPEERHT